MFIFIPCSLSLSRYATRPSTSLKFAVSSMYISLYIASFSSVSSSILSSVSVPFPIRYSRISLFVCPST